MYIYTSSRVLIMCAGEFGIVYRGTLSGWRNTNQDLIAVKTLKGKSHECVCECEREGGREEGREKEREREVNVCVCVCDR